MATCAPGLVWSGRRRAWRVDARHEHLRARPAGARQAWRVDARYEHLRATLLGVERGEPIRFVAQLAPRGGVKPPERLEVDRAVAVLPGPGDRAIDEERRRRVRVAHVEDLRPVLLGQDPRAAGVDEQRGV